MTENEKAKELIATSETTVKVDPQNGWYLKRFAALQFEGSVDNFSTWYSDGTHTQGLQLFAL